MLRKDKVLLESLTKKYGRNNVLNELKHFDNNFNKKGNYIREGYSSMFQLAERWFNNLAFEDLEYLTGLHRMDFFYDYYEYKDDELAEEKFIEACEEWWNEHTESEKVEIMNQWNKGEW